MAIHIQRSSIGILSLFIGLLLVSFFYVYVYFAPRDVGAGERDVTATSTGASVTLTTGYERARVQVDSATQVRELLNKQNNSINEELGK